MECSPQDLLAVMAATAHDDCAAVQARQQLVERYLPLATRLALRYRGRGVSVEDLIQVAHLALVGAVDRYDANRGSGLVAFAVLSIRGELKKHFRDSTWAVRVPRELQERVLAVRAATTEVLQ